MWQKWAFIAFLSDLARFLFTPMLKVNGVSKPPDRDEKAAHSSANEKHTGRYKQHLSPADVVFVSSIEVIKRKKRQNREHHQSYGHDEFCKDMGLFFFVHFGPPFLDGPTRILLNVYIKVGFMGPLLSTLLLCSR